MRGVVLVNVARSGRIAVSQSKLGHEGPGNEATGLNQHKKYIHGNFRGCTSNELMTAPAEAVVY